MLSRSLLTFGLTVILGLTLAAPETGAKPARPNKKKNLNPNISSLGAEHKHHGVIENVTHGKGGGSVTIAEHHKHKKGGKSKKPTAKAGGGKGKGGKSETFAVTPHTKILKHGKPASMSALHKGEHVVIHAHHKVASKIDIVHHKHKKKKKTKKT
jgi:hypothetical protein